MPEDDRDLMLAVKDGSREAFDELAQRWQGRLLGYFFRQGGDRELAEDCTQEVLVRLYRSRERYEPEAHFSTFLFTIARNWWIDVARARRVRPDLRAARGGDEETEGEDWMSRVPGTDAGPSTQAMHADEVARLRTALTRLPASLRDVVQLGVIESLPYSEVSTILSIPVGTVKSRVHAAVQALRTLLGGAGGGEDRK